MDSFGRVVFSRWDHLQRDQQADSDIFAILAGDPPAYGARTFESEASDASHTIAPGDEVFPEQRELYGDPAWDDRQPTETDHTFNHFFPWMMQQDGTGLGDPEPPRPPRAGRLHRARAHLPRLRRRRRRASTSSSRSPRTRRTPASTTASAAPSSARAAPGQIVSIDAPPGANADDIAVTYVTHPATASYVDEGAAPDPQHIGMFRDPVVLADGTLWAAHSNETRRRSRDRHEPALSAAVHAEQSLRLRDPAARAGRAGGYRVDGARLIETPIVESVTTSTTTATGP